MVSNPVSAKLGTQMRTHLDEANGVRLFTEALTADVETVLADDTAVVSADAAEKGMSTRTITSDD